MALFRSTKRLGHLGQKLGEDTGRIFLGCVLDETGEILGGVIVRVITDRADHKVGEPVLVADLGDSRTFPLAFPADYHGKDVAGKTADFMVTLKKLEAAHEPEVTDELAKSLGVAEPGWFAALKPYSLTDFWAAHPLLRILCEQPAIWTVPLAITLMVVISKATSRDVPSDARMKMLVLHAPEELGLKQEYIQEHQAGPGH